MKDAKAVTRQTLSILGTTPEAVMALKIPGITVLWAIRHGNKLRLGHLKANRFAIRLRDVNPTDVVKLAPSSRRSRSAACPTISASSASAAAATTTSSAPPSSARTPRACSLSSWASPMPARRRLADHRRTQGLRSQRPQARHEALAAQERHGAARPRPLIKTGKPGPAVRAIDERLRRLWVIAVQSWMFNQVLAQRASKPAPSTRSSPATWRTSTRTAHCFLVEDAAAEQPRAAALEISPTGPLVGYRMSLPTGEPLRNRRSRHGRGPPPARRFQKGGHEKVKGARRPLRVKPEDIDLAGGVDEHGPYITVAFTLPAGSFATVLIRELTKDRQPLTPEEAEISQTSNGSRPSWPGP